MIDHITLKISNYERSKEFYSKILAPLGYVLSEDNPNYKTAGFCRGNKRDVWISEGLKQTESHSFSCLAFGASNQAMVDAFYKAGVEAGGKDNGAPGYRPEYHPGYYATFVLDPDGHNLEAIFDDRK